MPVICCVPYYMKWIEELGIDPYFDFNTSLLPMEGSDGSVTILDAMQNPVDAVNVTLSTAQFRTGSSSAYFGTTNNGIKQAMPTVLSNVDVTIECWFKIDPSITSTSPSGMNLIDTRPGANGNTPCIYYANNTLALHVSGGDVINYPVTLANQWYHLAFTRAGNTARLFLNGTLVGSANMPGNMTNTYVAWGYNSLFARTSSERNFKGWMDDCRVTVGVARYTSSFVPTTTSYPIAFDVADTDPYYSKTSFLAKFDGANGATDTPAGGIVNSVTNTNLTTSTAFAVDISTTPKFGNGSLKFTGNGTRVFLPTDAMAFGTANFTMEVWVNLPTNGSGFRTIIGARPSNGNDTLGGSWGIAASGNIYWYTSGYVINTATGTIPNNTWTHLALVRNGTTLTLYMNGTSIGTGALGSASYSRPGAIGSNFDGSEPFVGSIDEVRITKGIARYTANFTAPTAPYPETSATDPSYNSVSVLVHADAQPSQYTIVNSGPSAGQLQNIGNLAVDSTLFKFGAGALKFSGDGSRAMLPTGAMNFGTSAFTIEAWVYVPTQTTGTYRSIVSSRPGDTNTSSGGVFGVSPTNTLYWYSDGFIAQSSATVPANSWNHVAVVRNGSAITIYLNGASVATGTSSYNLSLDGAMGGNFEGSQAFVGSIDELRITKGVARYTSAFSIPTAAFADNVSDDASYANISVLLHCELPPGVIISPNVIVDATGINNVKTNGAAALSNAVRRFGPTSLYVPPNSGGVTSGTIPSDALVFGTGDFTIEAWIFQLSTVTTPTVARTIVSSCGSNASYANALNFMVYNGVLGLAVGNSFYPGSSQAIDKDRWVHVAAVRSAGTTTLYADGVAVGTSATVLNFTDRILCVGCNNDGSLPFGGYIDSVRITKGLARMTNEWRPVALPHPTTATPVNTKYADNAGATDPFLSNTKFVLGITGASMTPANIVTPLALTNSAVLVGTDVFTRDYALKFYAGGSITSGADSRNQFAFGSSDVTYEVWINPRGVTGTQTVFDSRTSATATDGTTIYLVGENVTVQYGSMTPVGVGRIMKGGWTHVALVRSGTSVATYLNGQRTATVTIPAGDTNSGINFSIGKAIDGNNQFLGSLSGLRATTAVRYTDTFNPVA